jgi:hypothetical protein
MGLFLLTGQEAEDWGRDIQACLRGNQQKLYHLGFRGTVSRKTLAHANQIRDWRIYADFVQILIHSS